jgi:hypothetical protein
MARIGRTFPLSSTRVRRATVITHNYTSALSGSLSFVGSQTKAITRTNTGSLSFIGSIAAGHLFARTLIAKMPFGPSVWYAGPNSVNVSGNTGWDFS